MIMSYVLAFMAAAAVVFGALSGQMELVSNATVQGAKDAVSLMISIAGTLCFWSGVMEVLKRSGLSGKTAKLLRPIIKLLFGKYADDTEACAYISQNMASNLLGLGSAATPSGLKAAKRLYSLAEKRKEPPHAVFLLIIINTASLQLLPTTVAAVRASFGSQTPFDILPAVWLASAVSVTVGVLGAKLFKRRKYK